MRLNTCALSLVCLLWFCISAIGQTPENLRSLGQREYVAGHYVAAESYFRAALDAARLDDALSGGILADLGTLLLDEERLSDAEEAFTKSLAIRKRLGESQAIATALRNLGATYSVQRRDAEAIKLLNRALKTAQIPPTKSELIGHIYNSLGVSYFRQKRFKKAEEFFQQGLQTLINGGTYEAYAASLLNNLGATYCEQRKYLLAEEFMRKSLALASAQLGDTHPALADTLDGLGIVYTKLGRYAEAEAQFQRAIAILERGALRPSDVRIARPHKGLADTYILRGRKSEAAVALERAVMVARQNLTHPEMINILDTYSRLLVDIGKLLEAKEVRSEAQRARVVITSTIRAYDPN